MKFLTSLFISCFCLSSLLSMGMFPGRNLAANVIRVANQLRDKSYAIEANRRFHIGLKKNESVRYIINVPVYLSKTAIGIATDENVKKIRVVLYTQQDRDSMERSFYGEEIESSSFLKEITEKSYHYVVEITLLESSVDNNYSSVDLLVGYAPLPIKTEKEVTDFYYDHAGEREFYSDPIKARNAGRRYSDTGRIPCTALDYGKTCIR